MTFNEEQAAKRKARTREQHERAAEIRARIENWFDANAAKQHRRSRAKPSTPAPPPRDDQLPLNFDPAP